MIRGTTPTHYFEVDFDLSIIEKVNVLYGQNDVLLFKKVTADCTLENNQIVTKLTREDTLKFDHKKTAQVQLVAETLGGETIETVVMEIGVDKLLDDGVIE